MNNGGDQLARGMKSATFLPPRVSQEKWDAIWSEETETPAKKKIEISKTNLPTEYLGLEKPGDIKTENDNF